LPKPVLPMLVSAALRIVMAAMGLCS